MKKTKKLAALVLAMAMVFSCMVMPAMAHDHDDEGIMPMIERAICSRCGGEAELHERVYNGRTQTRMICLNGSVCGYDTGWRYI